jgi:hypothetical protein
MAVHLLESYPGAFVHVEEFDDWMANTIVEVAADPIWEDPQDRAIWESFVQRWHSKAKSSWIEERKLSRAAWIKGRQPKAGSRVQLRDDDSDEVTYICAPDLSRLGKLENRFRMANAGNIVARVTEDFRILVNRFGPQRD